MRQRVTIGAAIALALLFGFALGRASDRDETTATVQVTAADHEVEEGYFSLGQTATLMVKPGSDMYRFLCRQRGHKIKITMSQEDSRQLSRIDR